MKNKTNACRILDQLKIPYSLHEYAWNEQTLDAVTVAGKIGLPASQVFKTLVLLGDPQGVLMACVPGNQELNLKILAKVSGNKKVTLAAVKDLLEWTGYVRGGVSPLGSKKRFPLYLDVSVLDLDPVSVSAGRRGLQIFLKGQDLVQATQGVVAGLCL
ncbi:Cys-tRNA(Pro) deacylase [Alicyclobacillaceae bacterium I2511]|nr:Cys-tRNA(Pro) deacylase [Alicyclobacillaceae bacterium I2511]